MKKTFAGIAALSMFAIGSAQAAVGAQGTITFNGAVNADSCVVTGAGATNAGKNLIVDMGEVSVNSLGTEAQPMQAANGFTAIEKTIDIKVECVTGTDVELKLTPQTVSGKGIAVTGGSENVQIMLVTNKTPLDFTGGTQTLEANLNGQSVVIPLSAYYTLVGNKTAADVKPGEANATVAYELSYN